MNIRKIVGLFLCFNTVVTTQKISSLFNVEKGPLQGETIVTKVDDIIKIMDETADFIQKIKKHPSKFVTVTAGLFSDFGVTVDDVLETVEFIADIGRRKPEMLQSPWFLNTHFTFYRWHGDPTQKINHIAKGWKKPPESVVTTQYRITEIPASRTKTTVFMYPIYSLPHDEIRLTREQVLKKQHDLLRFKYSRTQILSGVLDHSHQVVLLGWVTDAGRKEFGMQGSVLLSFNDDQKELIRVAGNNGMKDTEEYWFADHVKKRKYSKFPVKVKPRADVTYAGDMNLLGFGKVIMLICWNPKKQKNEVRLGVLVDTGSAFKNNLAKLDMFTGYFPTKSAFQKHIQSYPQTARAYILIKKKSVID